MIMIFGTLVSNGDISRCFFQFFKILVFRVLREVKVEKMVQSDKKFCPTCLTSQEPYIKWLSFMVHMCKMTISPGGFFHSLKTLIFWVVRGVKG